MMTWLFNHLEIHADPDGFFPAGGHGCDVTDNMKQRCLRCRSRELCPNHGSYRLVSQDKLDPSMWINKYVIRHYRPANMTNKMCAKSIFHWTNETINIWSHLLGFIYFTYCQYEMNAYRIPLMGGHFEDHLVISLSIFGSQVCMLFSAAYHTFCCANERKRQKFLKLDIFGISAGLLGMYLSGIYTAFFCFQDHLETYFYMLMSIFFITAYVPTREDFFDRKIVGSRIGYLHIIYTSIIIFGFCPTTHWVYLHGGLANDHVANWLVDIFILYGLMALAFFFYVTLIPERLCPGAFDLVGCSHQWWHIFILSAMVFWQRAGVDLLGFYRMNESSCRDSISSLRGNSSAVYL
uniref:Progestin and adipoQ receptor family member 3 n=2 Tax=Haemonchus contortus TaxID=6289 RepID=A0A7I4YIS6_HAECO